MTIFHVILLAIVEGITEFLPISSTGHMILVGHVLNISQTEFVKSFEIIIQFGAILAVVVLYFNYLWENKNLWLKLIAAFLPTALIGLVLYKFIKHFLLGNILVTVLALFLGGIVLLLVDKFFKNNITNVKSLNQLTYKDATLIGTAQALSVIPGVSRAAATIVGGLAAGLTREDAVKFSFLLAIPTMAAATGLDLLKSGFSFNSNEYVILGIGFLIAFITAFLVVKFFVKFVQKNNFAPFAIYRIIFSLLYFLVFIKL